MPLFFSSLLVTISVLAAANKVTVKQGLKEAIMLLTLLSAAVVNIYIYDYEFGLTYLFIQLSLLAWLVIILINKPEHKLVKKPVKKKPAKQFAKKNRPAAKTNTIDLITSTKSVAIHIFQFFRKLIVPLVLSLAISSIFPWLLTINSSNTLIFSAFSFFIIWPISWIFYLNAKSNPVIDLSLLCTSIILFTAHII